MELLPRLQNILNRVDASSLNSPSKMVSAVNGHPKIKYEYEDVLWKIWKPDHKEIELNKEEICQVTLKTLRFSMNSV